VAGQDEGADGLRPPALQGVLDGQRVAQALAHLDAFERQRTGQRPVAGEGRVVDGFALGHFALVVGEDVLQAAAVDVERLAQVFGGHGRAFDVPAGEAHAPRAVPAQDVLRFGFLPQSEVGRVALLLAHGHAGALFQFLDDAAA